MQTLTQRHSVPVDAAKTAAIAGLPWFLPDLWRRV